MEFLFVQLKKLLNNYILVLLIILLIVINDALILNYCNSLKSRNVDSNILSFKNVQEYEKPSELDKINVDIKGYVKKPGVYIAEKGMTVNDIIKLSGGLKKNASTDNINLSKKVSDEMVIIVSSKKETSNQILTKNNCKNDALIINDESANISLSSTLQQNVNAIKSSPGLLNLNSASKDELLTLNGIGESKADAIISYRNEHRFTVIEDIKNVPGIGESLFEKIKGSITV